MTQAAVSELDERVPGRRWTVRLDAAGRGSAAVRVSCSRPACTEQRLPTAVAGRVAGDRPPQGPPARRPRTPTRGVLRLQG